MESRLAHRVGFEPTTARLTAGCSTAELTMQMGVAYEKHYDNTSII